MAAEARSDDIAELAELVAALTDRLAGVAPDQAEALAGIRQRAERLASSDRGAVRIDSVAANSIAVAEPDGSVRVLMSGRATFPTSVQIAGKVIENPRDYAGILFFNDEGDECGGLIFGGEGGYQGGSLTFDQYHGDQVIQFWHEDSEAGRTAALLVNDQPDMPLPEVIERWEAIRALPDGEQAEARQRLRAEGAVAARRLMAGKERDGSSRVTLAGSDGAVRLALKVTADGVPSIEIYGGGGEVVWRAP